MQNFSIHYETKEKKKKENSEYDIRKNKVKDIIKHRKLEESEHKVKYQKKKIPFRSGGGLMGKQFLRF